MQRYSGLKQNMKLMFLGNVLSKTVIFLMLPFYTLTLTKQEYGEIDLMNTYVYFLLPIVTLQIFESTFRFSRNKKKGNQEEYFSSSLFIFITIYILLLVILLLIFSKNLWVGNTIYFLVILLMMGLMRIFQEFTRALDKIKIYAISGILYTIVFVSLNFLLIIDYGVRGYYLSIIISSTITLLWLLITGGLLGYIKFHKVKKNKIKEMLVYSSPLIPTAVIWWLINLSDRLFLKYYIGNEALGVYAVSTKFPMILTTLFLTFYKSWEVSAVDSFQEEDFPVFYNDVFNKMSKFFILCSITIVLLISPLLNIVVSQEYQIAWKYTPPLLLGACFSIFSSFLGVNYVTFKKTNGALKSSSIAAIFNLVGNFLLIPQHGVMGASISTLLSYIFLFFIRYLDTRKFIVLKPKMSMQIMALLIVSIIVVYSPLGYTNKILATSICLIYTIHLANEYIKISIKFMLKFIGK